MLLISMSKQQRYYKLKLTFRKIVKTRKIKFPHLQKQESWKSDFLLCDVDASQYQNIRILFLTEGSFGLDGFKQSPIIHSQTYGTLAHRCYTDLHVIQIVPNQGQYCFQGHDTYVVYKHILLQFSCLLFGLSVAIIIKLSVSQLRQLFVISEVITRNFIVLAQEWLQLIEIIIVTETTGSSHWGDVAILDIALFLNILNIKSKFRNVHLDA